MSDTVDRLNAALKGRYRVQGELGEGGMATVYLADDLRHGRKVALKVLKPELAAAVGSDRFVREIRVTASLQHPHILPLFDSGVARSLGEGHSLLYYVMPHIEGETLRRKLDRERQLPIDEAFEIARVVASALDFAHERGVVHRDLKPENILLQGGVALVADFGIAIALSAAGSDRLTETGLSLGTPAYMSPEQISGERDVDARSDVYALGCLTYEMLAGTPPFIASTPVALLAKHVTEVPPPVTTARPSVSAASAAALERALSKTPADRPKTAGALVEALTRGGTAAAHAEPTTEEVRRSIVVLPFDNMSPDPDDSYFTDGLTEEVTADLSRIRALGVISRTSAMRLKGSDKNVRQIGRELGVRYVLEGSVRKSGQTVRITAQLIDAESDEHLWAEKYSGSLDNVFEIQERVAGAIADALRIELSPVEKEEIASRSIEDPRAYESYLRARYEMYRFSAEGMAAAIRHLRNALDIVGDNEALLATLGHAHIQHRLLGVDADPIHVEAAEAVSKRLLEAFPDSRRIHRLEGMIAFTKGDMRLASSQLQRALEFDPDDPDALMILGYAMALVGREDRAATLFERLLRVDPLTPVGHAMPGFLAILQGRHDDALDGYRTYLEMDDRGPFSLMCWILTLVNLDDRLDEAADVSRELSSRYPGTPFTSVGEALVLARRGRGEGALKAVSPALLATAAENEMLSRFLTQIYSMAGDLDSAIPWLENTIRLGNVNHPYWTRISPLMGEIRDDPRFVEIMHDVEHTWRGFQA